MSPWTIDGDGVTEVVDERRTFTELQLTWRTDRPTRDNVLRPLSSSAGKADEVPTADGGFRGYDRADGDNAYQLSPPAAREPLRVAGEFYVLDYREEVVDQQTETYEVAVTWLASSPRESTSGDPSPTPTADEWRFAFHTGTITTHRVEADVGTQGKDDLATVALRAVLTQAEAKLVEESCSHEHGVRIRPVPDGQNVAEDNTPTGRQTVDLRLPDNAFDARIRLGDARLGNYRLGLGSTAAIAQGAYRVSKWETIRLNDDWQRVDLDLIEA